MEEGTELLYRPAYVHGRHIIDTFQQIQRWDVGGKLDRYGLKAVVRDLGLERSDRTFVEGEDIPTLWREDPDRLMSYALDDVRDVRLLSDLIVPVEFYQTQVLPNTFQDVARWGTGEKINALMVRAYLLRGRAIPKPQSSRPYAGGYTELKAAGIFEHVVKADVESLYPSIMLTYKIKPSSGQRKGNACNCPCSNNEERVGTANPVAQVQT